MAKRAKQVEKELNQIKASVAGLGYTIQDLFNAEFYLRSRSESIAREQVEGTDEEAPVYDWREALGVVRDVDEDENDWWEHIDLLHLAIQWWKATA